MEKPIKTEAEKLEGKPLKDQIREITKKLLKNIKEHKKAIRNGIIISLCTLLLIYLGMSAYFTKHFYFGSEINSVSISGKTVDEANKQMAAALKTYILILNERGGKTEQIKAEDIGLKYSSNGQFQGFKDKQNAFKWVLAAFNKEESKMTEEVLYNGDLLNKKINSLACLDSKNIIEPKSASFKYTDNGYAIVDEVAGNKINKDVLYNHIVNAILKGKTTLNLESIDCYVKPKYTKETQKVMKVKNMLDKYVSSKITYTFESKKEVVDGAAINKWISVDDDLEVAIDERQVRSYVDTLAGTYNTYGESRRFTTASGKVITVRGGDYGWIINKPKEVQNLIAAVKQGKTISKEPSYSQTAASHNSSSDIGNTYVEIDLTKQHMWFYKNGSLVVEGDVVTGNISRNNGTPAGVYKLKYKERNAILKGQDYASPVDYWMPFNGNIGIHDASWRSKFGGEIYRRSGSHGCVNSPHYLAEAIYSNIKAGAAVVCHY